MEGNMLSKIKNICEPEKLAELQKIFDSAWAEVESTGKVLPDEREAARTRMASYIMALMGRPDVQDTGKLRNEVIEAFWTEPSNGPCD
jgi:hypothetical protein